VLICEADKMKWHDNFLEKLTQAERHVIEGREIVARLRALVARLKEAGYDASDAERFSDKFERIVTMFEHRHHAALEELGMLAVPTYGCSKRISSTKTRHLPWRCRRRVGCPDDIRCREIGVPPSIKRLLSDRKVFSAVGGGPAHSAAPDDDRI
jgi:hypothetical protein